jgi:hypothetical protein
MKQSERREKSGRANRDDSRAAPSEASEVASPVAELDIDPGKVCFVIIKAREFHAKVDIVEADPGSNPSDEGFREVLEDHGDDPTYEELKSLISSLNEDEIANLLALAWIGRGDFAKEDWESAVAEARQTEDDKAADYLIATPLISDYLEEGLSQLGHSCEDYETGRL